MVASRPEIKCLVCGEPPIDGGPPPRASVVCADCGTFHHRECFEYNEKCAVYACGAYRCSSVGRGGRDVQLLVVGRPDVERVERLILDLTTPAEEVARTLVTIGICLMFIGVFPIFTAIGKTLSLLPGVLAFMIGLVLMSTTDCYYIADARERQLIYHQKIAGVLHVRPFLALGGIARLELAVRAEWVAGDEDTSAHWRHVLWLEALDERGRATALSDEVVTDDPEWWTEGKQILARGRQLARIADLKLELAPRRYHAFTDGPVGWMKAVALATLAAVLALPSPEMKAGFGAAGATIMLLLLAHAMNRSGGVFNLEPVPGPEQSLVLLGRDEIRDLMRARAAPRLPPGER